MIPEEESIFTRMMCSLTNPTSIVTIHKFPCKIAFLNITVEYSCCRKALAILFTLIMSMVFFEPD